MFIPIRATVIPSNPCPGGPAIAVIPFWFPKYKAIAPIPERAPAIANETMMFSFVLYPEALAAELLNPVAFSLNPSFVNLNNAQISTAATIAIKIAVFAPDLGKISESHLAMKLDPS